MILVILFLSVIAVIVVVAGGIPCFAPRIIGGNPVSFASKYPSVVAVSSLKPRGNRVRCGGLLIASNWVVTATQCVFGHNLSDIVVGMGSTNWSSPTMQIVGITGANVHPRYAFSSNGLRIRNDITLLRLDRNVRESRCVKFGCIPPNSRHSYGRHDVTAVGWGFTGRNRSQSDILQEISIPYLDDPECDDLLAKTKNELHAGQLCAGGSGAGGKGASDGDGGSPLFYQCRNDENRTVAIGLASLTPSFSAEPYQPTVYTKLAFYSSWIQKNVDGAQLCLEGCRPTPTTNSVK